MGKFQTAETSASKRPREAITILARGVAQEECAQNLLSDAPPAVVL
jgi:hypothetical protein